MKIRRKKFSFHQLFDKKEKNIYDSYSLWKLLSIMYILFSEVNTYLDSQELLQIPFKSDMFMHGFSRKQ